MTPRARRERCASGTGALPREEEENRKERARAKERTRAKRQSKLIARLRPWRGRSANSLRVNDLGENTRYRLQPPIGGV